MLLFSGVNVVTNHHIFRSFIKHLAGILSLDRIPNTVLLNPTFKVRACLKHAKICVFKTFGSARVFPSA